MEKIKVSLILTTWNGEKKLKNALRSIKSQTYKNIELIICDDKSTDNSYEVLKNEVIGIKNYKIIKNKVNLGAWKNFINGVQRSKGDYICWMCQDDHWSCNYVEEIVIAINKFTFYWCKYDYLNKWR